VHRAGEPYVVCPLVLARRRAIRRAFRGFPLWETLRPASLAFNKALRAATVFKRLRTAKAVGTTAHTTAVTAAIFLTSVSGFFMTIAFTKTVPTNHA
jgi:hypothetical protein